MAVAALWFNLLAQVPNLDRFVSALRNRKGRTDSGEWIAGLLMWVAALVAVWVIARILERRSRRRSYSSPGRLLFSLCRAHGLRWSQWWLLRQIARQEKLEDPARLFLEPGLLDPARLGPPLAARRREILVLRARLFADLSEFGGLPEMAPAKGPNVAAARQSPMPLFPAATVPSLDLPERPSPPPTPPANG